VFVFPGSTSYTPVDSLTSKGYREYMYQQLKSASFIIDQQNQGKQVFKYIQFHCF
jgi:hypothetical protein